MATTTPSSKQVAGYSIDDARRFLAMGRVTKREGQDHGYSPLVAEQFGIPAALVLKYLSFCTSKSKRVDQGIQWYSQSIADIASRYPYLSASTVHAALKGIPENLLARRRRKDRRTRAISTEYAFCDQAFEAEVNSRPVYFDPEQAQRFGIHAAVVLHYVQHCIRVYRKRQPDYWFHPISPTEAAQKLGISRASVNRALSALVEGGMLDKNPNPSGRFPEYGPRLSLQASGASLKSGTEALKPD
jgi:IclR helix-turn-helix domain